MDQADIVRALQSGSATGDAAALHRIDTHLSHVFLAPDRVYKLKRAVRMPFVDFSTIERRRAACEAELEINRRFAPAMYLAALPIVRTDAGLKLGGAGKALDWLVVMRRFADADLFDAMAQEGRLTPELVAGAVEAVARFHAGAQAAPGHGRLAGYLDIVEKLRRTEADGAAAHGLQAGPGALYDRLRTALGELAPLIETRRAAGKVRRGHGDLHLRNICLFEGRPTPFDALEFDPALATSDVLYDLAFLLMDLRRYGLLEHANVAMNRYWDIAGEDEAGLALLPAFMALRAGVRAAVAMEAGDPAEAGGYRSLGLELLAPAAPRLVMIGGLSGSGKSAVARRLAPGLGGPCGARLLRTDVIRKAMAGRATRLEAEAYRPERRAEVYRMMAGRVRNALAVGASVLADATFQDAEARSLIGEAAGDAPPDRIWLRASPEIRARRVSARAGDASDADAVVAAAQREPALEPGWRIIDAEGALDAVVRAAEGVLGA